MIGMKRKASLTDLRGAYKLFKDKAEYKTETRIEHFATWVHDFNEEKGGWRRHAHIIWTCKETRHSVLLKWLEDSAGEQCSLWVDKNVEESPWKLGYVLQYQAQQKGESVRFSMSRGWLPQRYDLKWTELMKTKEDRTLGDIILDLNSWIDIERLKHRDWTQQTRLLFDAGKGKRNERPYRAHNVMTPEGDGQVSKHAFIKRSLRR